MNAAFLGQHEKSREIVAEETAEFKPRDKRQKAPAGRSAVADCNKRWKGAG